jgi:hypothetical protein
MLQAPLDDGNQLPYSSGWTSPKHETVPLINFLWNFCWIQSGEEYGIQYQALKIGGEKASFLLCIAICAMGLVQTLN